MPWSCCGRAHPDSARACPSCGRSKGTWTVAFARTRLFQLRRRAARAWLELRVRDQFGRPVAARPVVVAGDGEEHHEDVLDEAGGLRLELDREGTWTLWFADLDARTFEPFPEPALGPRLEPLRVVLRDADGRPRPRVRYRVEVPGAEPRVGLTDAEGALHEPLLPAGAYALTFPDLDAACFEPPAPAPGATAALRFVARDDLGRPLAGARFRAELLDGSVREGRLDDRGRAVLVDVPAGAHRVTFPDLDAACFEPPGAPALDDAEVHWLALALVDTLGRPLAGRRFEVDRPGRPPVTGVLDARGRARVAGLPRGPLAVRFPDLDATCFR